MAEQADWVVDGYLIGRLISFALKSARPSKDGEYKKLIDRYKYEEPFAAAVDGVLEGMGLQVLNETTQALRTGLVLCCLGQTSPFAPNVESHARGLTRDQRMALGLIHLGTMSFFYPQVDDDSQDDFRSRSGTPSEICEDIRQLCDTLCEQLKHSDDNEPPTNARQVFEAFSAMPPAPARGGLMARSTQIGLVNHALLELKANGFLAFDGGEGLNTRFVSLPKYRIYVRRLASHEIAKLIRQARQKQADHARGASPNV